MIFLFVQDLKPRNIFGSVGSGAERERERERAAPAGQQASAGAGPARPGAGGPPAESPSPHRNRNIQMSLSLTRLSTFFSGALFFLNEQFRRRFLPGTPKFCRNAN